jgi:hypothetical protein
MRPILLVFSLLVLAGCGGGASKAPKTADDVTVIRGWAADIRKGDMDAAAARFSVPARVANGTPEITLSSRAAVRQFNASLPCGAELLGTKRHAGVTIATFRLTNRPGGECGSGTGGTASTAFEIVGGKITRWLRVPQTEDREENPVGEVV